MSPAGFTPDPARLYEVGRDGRPYTLEPEKPGSAEALEALGRRWWTAAVLLNAVAMGVAAGGALLGPRVLAAWLGLLPLLTAPLFLVAPWLRRRALRRGRRVHRSRPPDFPPPSPPRPSALS
ncbi:hypothetical protein [Muricoccus pecuniae]|uniref:Uncharacterized protein n=1 Tax=Muricoccus pecuniae TaxID=693023 RepID=A0A840Y4F3_9PROT|nr:hypothetical protein [Roseomonas pecuniae]MBB5693659.1 hypothetical protein [Roseomonas pecuniae]